MFKHRLANFALLLAVVFVLGLVLGIGFPRWAKSRSTPKVYNTATILKQVQGLSELVTVKYVMERIEVLTDPPQNPLRAALPDDTHVTLIAHGIVKAGVDLARISPSDVRASGKKIVLTLPGAQITDAYLDDKLTQVVERNTGFLREFNKDLEQTARQNAIDDIRRSARTTGILKDAEERARAQLTHLCKQLGFAEVEFAKR
jgi:Protein of unknown function (DUF4230)